MRINSLFEKNIKALASLKEIDCDYILKKYKVNDLNILNRKLIDFDKEKSIQDFLSQIDSEKPILLKDCYNIKDLEWMCDRLRDSNVFGFDNKLYLTFSSLDDFFISFNYLEWFIIINLNKIVFMLCDKDFVEYNNSKITNKKNISQLKITEINELVCTMINGGFSGTDFFNMILDNHPNLLTVSWHGLSSFCAIFKIFCENKPALQAIESMKRPRNDNEKELINRELRKSLKYKFVNRIDFFFDNLSKILSSEKIYSISDWFKAFFLSINITVGRSFKQRIVPAIFYDKHGGYDEFVVLKFKIEKRELNLLLTKLIKSFKYRKYIACIRHPSSRIGCLLNFWLKRNQTVEYIMPMLKFSLFLAFNYINDVDFHSRRVVRFEDLKLFPRETILEICKFLRIPWSNTLLYLTTNGEDSGSVDGTKGFDVTPVYNKHLEFLSEFDYFRIEYAFNKFFNIYGYKCKFYHGESFDVDEINKLYRVPFRIEEKYPNLFLQKNTLSDYRLILRNEAIKNNINYNFKNLDLKNLVKCIYPKVKRDLNLHKKFQFFFQKCCRTNVYLLFLGVWNFAHMYRQKIISLGDCLRVRILAAKFADQKVYFWGNGAAWHKYGKYFKGVLPQCFLVDQTFCIEREVDGIPVCTPEVLLAKKAEALPSIMFVREENLFWADKMRSKYSNLIRDNLNIIVLHNLF